MKTRAFQVHGLLTAAATLFVCRLTQAAVQVAEAEQRVAAMPYGNALGQHPVAEMVAHVIFLALIVGVGASIVSALFRKAPFLGE